MKALILFLALNSAHAGRFTDWWAGFCERHLVAEDPYQYEALTNDQIVDLYHAHKRQRFESQALLWEIQNRLAGDLSYEDREILSKLKD
jgi:hypothetical protein